jgi:hypothetical protein
MAVATGAFLRDNPHFAPGLRKTGRHSRDGGVLAGLVLSHYNAAGFFPREVKAT